MWEQQCSIRIWAGTRLHPDLGAARQDLPGPARILMLDCLYLAITSADEMEKLEYSGGSILSVFRYAPDATIGAHIFPCNHSKQDFALVRIIPHQVLFPFLRRRTDSRQSEDPGLISGRAALCDGPGG